MAVRLREAHASRGSRTGVDDASVELVFMCLDSDDDLEIKAALIATGSLPNGAPDTYDGLPKSEVAIEQLANEVWRGTVTYGNGDKQESVFSFDTGGGTTKIQRADVVDSAPVSLSLDPPDLGGAINYDGENVDGVDITIPALKYSETHYFDDALVTLTYVKTLAQLTGSVNNDTFKGFDAGEVLFIGASGTKRGRGDWEITFNFELSSNLTSLDVGLADTLDKKGWEYLWLYFKDTDDTTANELVKTPHAGYVHEVYKPQDFSLIGIGT